MQSIPTDILINMVSFLEPLHDEYSNPRQGNTPTLLNLCLVDRRFHAVAQRALHSHLHVPVRRSARPFLVAMLHNPPLALALRSVYYNRPLLCDGTSLCHMRRQVAQSLRGARGRGG